METTYQISESEAREYENLKAVFDATVKEAADKIVADKQHLIKLCFLCLGMILGAVVTYQWAKVASCC